MGRFFTAVGLIATLLLTGCDPFSQPDSLMDEYVERLGRVLDVEPEYSALPVAERLPRRRERRLEMPDLEMGMLEFFSLYGCDLQYVVGEKNSVMGRVMQPLNRLRYEVRFIEAARECLPEIDDESLHKDVEKAIASKIESLPIAVWNATWAVEEVESMFTLSKGRLPVEESEATTADLAGDLETLEGRFSALLSGELDDELSDIGEVHQGWQSGHRPGQLINSARLLIARLGDATAVIRQRLDGSPLCLESKPNERSKRLMSMFTSVYIEQVQPYLADVRRARDDIFRPFGELVEKQRPVMPSGFQAFQRQTLSLEGEESLWTQLDRAMEAHTGALQSLLEQCGQRPQA